MKKFKMPSAFTILFVIIIIVAVLTFIIPAGAYDIRIVIQIRFFQQAEDIKVFPDPTVRVRGPKIGIRHPENESVVIEMIPLYGRIRNGFPENVRGILLCLFRNKAADVFLQFRIVLQFLEKLLHINIPGQYLFNQWIHISSPGFANRRCSKGPLGRGGLFVRVSRQRRPCRRASRRRRPP